VRAALHVLYRTYCIRCTIVNVLYQMYYIERNNLKELYCTQCVRCNVLHALHCDERTVMNELCQMRCIVRATLPSTLL
jgi:hypothetical protein